MEIDPSSRTPVRDHRQATENHRTICGVRGYCGPFVNEHVYNNFPDPMWHGCAECIVCGSTCLVAHEEYKRRQADAVKMPLPPPDAA